MTHIEPHPISPSGLHIRILQVELVTVERTQHVGVVTTGKTILDPNVTDVGIYAEVEGWLPRLYFDGCWYRNTGGEWHLDDVAHYPYAGVAVSALYNALQGRIEDTYGR